MSSKRKSTIIRVWYAFERFADDLPAFFRLTQLMNFGPPLFKSAKRILAFDAKDVHPVEAEYVHRRLYLASFESMLTLPVCILCLALLSSTIKDPKRMWGFWGAIVALVLCFTIDLIIYVSTGDSEFGMMRSCWPTLNIGAIAGFALSTRYSKTKACTAAVVDGSSVEHARTPAATENDAKKGDANGQAAPVGSQDVDMPNWACIMGMIIFSILIAIPSTNTFIPTWATPAAEYDTSTWIGFWFSILGLGFFGLGYGATVYAWIKTTTHLLREVSFGLSLAAISMVVLRSTTPFSSWPSWAIDSSLAFMLFNIGVLAGTPSRIGVPDQKPVIESNEKHPST